MPRKALMKWGPRSCAACGRAALGCLLIASGGPAHAAAQLGPAPAPTMAPPAPRALHRDRLPNGLDLIVLEQPDAPLATILLAVRTGAFTQSAGHEGAAHLFEHLLFRAFRSRRSSF